MTTMKAHITRLPRLAAAESSFGVRVVAALILLAATLAPDGVALAQTAADTHDPDGRMVVPKSGLEATIRGEHIILNQDGTWKHETDRNPDRAMGMTADGHMVELTITREDDGTQKKEWKYLGTGGGPLQVAITRAVTTDQSIHSDRDNCIPVITIRNLTKVTLHRILLDIEFVSADDSHGGTSLMMGPLDDGDQQEYVSPPLFVPGCKGLTATLRVPYCTFRDGARCENVVIASAWGVVPLTLKRESAATTLVQPAQSQ